MGSVVSGGSLCHPNPCKNGGTCDTHDGIFTCYCARGFAGSLCQHDVSSSNGSIGVASFTGGADSLMAVLTPDDAVNRIEVELEFRTFSDNGIIVFSHGSNSAGEPDFLSIALVNGYVLKAFYVRLQKFRNVSSLPVTSNFATTSAPALWPLYLQILCLRAAGTASSPPDTTGTASSGWTAARRGSPASQRDH